VQAKLGIELADDAVASVMRQIDTDDSGQVGLGRIVTL
jgi:hypothetical protein